MSGARRSIGEPGGPTGGRWDMAPIGASGWALALADIGDEQ